jgi:hypothetical protein
LRPVRSAARVGEQIAVVWKSLYLSPLLASRSKFGVGMGPPKVPDEPKPASSVMISRTLGAPAGATSGLGKSGFDSLTVFPTWPAKGAGGLGRAISDGWAWSAARRDALISSDRHATPRVRKITSNSLFSMRALFTANSR